MLDPKIDTLLAVYDLKSFTKAAAELSLTQPAVSQHVKQLEEELDTKIFNRGEGELRLTAEGEIVIKYARRMKFLYQNLREALVDEKKHLTSLTVGVTHTEESNHMAEILAKYCNEKGDVRIKIISDTINNLYMRLKTYEVDIAIVEGKFADSNFNSIQLDTDSLVLAVSNSNPLAKKSIVTLNELKKEKMILRLPNSGTRNLFVSHLESNNASIDEFNVIMEVDNIATIKELIRHDLGVSILAKSACISEARKGKITILPVENLSMTRDINVIYHKDFEHIGILDGITRAYFDSKK